MRAYSFLSLFLLLWLSIVIAARPIPGKKDPDHEIYDFTGKMAENEDIARALGVGPADVPDNLSDKQRSDLAAEGAALDPDTPKDDKSEFRAKPEEGKTGKTTKKKKAKSRGGLGGLWDKVKGWKSKDGKLGGLWDKIKKWKPKEGGFKLRPGSLTPMGAAKTALSGFF